MRARTKNQKTNLWVGARQDIERRAHLSNQPIDPPEPHPVRGDRPFIASR
jgi:hypothetical protein